MLSDICLSVCLSVCLTFVSVAYIGPKSRTERPRKTKIGTDVAHVTRDSDTTFKVKGSKVNLQGAGAYCGGLPHSLFSAKTTVHLVTVERTLGPVAESSLQVFTDFNCFLLLLSKIKNVARHEF